MQESQVKIFMDSGSGIIQMKNVPPNANCSSICNNFCLASSSFSLYVQIRIPPKWDEAFLLFQAKTDKSQNITQVFVIKM